MATESKKKDVILTGVPEVDEKLGGGIPLGSLCLIEGHSDAGKVSYASTFPTVL